MIKQFYLTYWLTLIGTITPGQSGLGSNGYETVFHIPQSSRIEGSSSDAVYCHTQGIISV